MVFVVRKSAAYRILRKIYDKPRWYKINVLFNEFKEHNPTLAAILPASGIFLTLYSAVIIGLNSREFIPKYNECIVIMRPDDPRVENITKTDNMRIRFDPLQPTLFVYSV
ncbi:hypothetical protein ANTRET_LOCUS6686 [Anthophora retusa]